MQILTDGFIELGRNFLPVMVFLITCAGWGWLVVDLFLPAAKLPGHVKLLMSLPVGVVPLALFSYVFIELARTWSPAFHTGAFVLLLIGVIAFGMSVLGAKPRKLSARVLLTWLLFGILYIAFLALRLAYNKDLLLPPYHDSVEHYRILTGFLTPVTTPPLFSGTFYHSGFHSIGAWLVVVSGIEPENAIMLLGQVLLSFVPLSLYAFIWIVIGQPLPSLAAALVGAFYWQMPAYAVNWGKYPALTAIIILPALLAVMAILLRQPKSQATVIRFWLAVGLFAAGITFLHSRAFFCFLVGLCLLFVNHRWVSKFGVKTQRVVALLALAAFLNMFFLSSQLVWIFAVPTLPFVAAAVGMLVCAYFQPRVSSLWSLSALLVFALTRLPVPGFLHLDSPYWMDIPFYQAFLFLPLSFMTGTGLYAIFEKAGDRKWSGVAVLTGLAALFIFVAWSQPYTPDECCNYVSEDDLAGIEWVGMNIPDEVRIAIPGRVDIYPKAGTDAGIWVEQLTGKTTFLLPFDYTWYLEDNHREICAGGDTYVFSGSFPLSFQLNTITHPDWYQVEYQSGGDVIYHVIGCGQ